MFLETMVSENLKSFISSRPFTGKHLCKSLFFNKVTGKKRLWHSLFPVNFLKFLRAPFLIEYLRWLLLELSKNLSKTFKCISHINFDVDLDGEGVKNIFGRKRKVFAFSSICGSVQS